MVGGCGELTSESSEKSESSATATVGTAVRRVFFFCGSSVAYEERWSERLEGCTGVKTTNGTNGKVDE
jgi:hypothetical protein